MLQTVLSLTLGDVGTNKNIIGCLAQFLGLQSKCAGLTELTLRYSQIGVSRIQVNVGR